MQVSHRPGLSEFIAELNNHVLGLTTVSSDASGLFFKNRFTFTDPIQ